MINAFNSDNYPNQEPKSLVTGSRWAWTRSDISETYPADTYTLKYVFASQAEDKSYTVTATKYGTEHRLEVSAATTKTYKAADYIWKAVIVRDSDSEEIVIDQGFIEFKRQTGAVNSHVYKVLSAIRATLEGKASKDQMSYSINGRSLSRYTFKELTDLEKQYLARWKQEKAEIDRENGRTGVKNKVLIKLGA